MKNKDLFNLEAALEGVKNLKGIKFFDYSVVELKEEIMLLKECLSNAFDELELEDF